MNNEVRRAISDRAQNETVRKVGRFRALIWPDAAARDAAGALMARTPHDKRDDDFWAKYYAHCDDVKETPNVAIKDGLSGLLRWAAGISTTVEQFSSTKTFLGVGNGMVIGQIRDAFTANGSNDSITVRESPSNWDAGNNYNTYALSISVGDVLLFTDTSTAPPSTSPWPAAPVNPEYAEVASVSSPSGSPLARTITFTKPLRYSRSAGTYVAVSGRSNAVGLSASGFGSDKAFKAVSGSFPTEGIVDGMPTLTWQVDYDADEAQFHWVEACIGSVASPPSSAQDTTPSGAVLLAKAAWYPSPLVKGNTLASQQYLFSLG
jgi:hypothetical protein